MYKMIMYPKGAVKQPQVKDTYLNDRREKTKERTEAGKFYETHGSFYCHLHAGYILSRINLFLIPMDIYMTM